MKRIRLCLLLCVVLAMAGCSKKEPLKYYQSLSLEDDYCFGVLNYGSGMKFRFSNVTPESCTVEWETVSNYGRYDMSTGGKTGFRINGERSGQQDCTIETYEFENGNRLQIVEGISLSCTTVVGTGKEFVETNEYKLRFGCYNKEPNIKARFEGYGSEGVPFMDFCCDEDIEAASSGDIKVMVLRSETWGEE